MPQRQWAMSGLANWPMKFSFAAQTEGLQLFQPQVIKEWFAL